MKRILLTTFFLFSCFYAQARHIPESSPVEKPLLGHFCQNCPNSHPEKLLYLVEVQQGYILFLDEKPCQSLYPLGYVDGFGLYGAYFAQGFGLDPSGLVETPMGTVGVDQAYQWSHDQTGAIWGPVGIYYPNPPVTPEKSSTNGKIEDCDCENPKAIVEKYIKGFPESVKKNFIAQIKRNCEMRKKLTPCPATVAEVKAAGYQKESQTTSKKFHPGSEVCYRKREVGQKYGNQCCYDCKGKLITEGPGAGTPDNYCPYGITDGTLVNDHFNYDVVPFNMLVGLLGAEKGVEAYHCMGWAPHNSPNAKPNKGCNVK